MAGSKRGGAKAAETNKRRYGENYFAVIGSLGGSKKVPKGFAINKDLARKAGSLGGKVSRRPKKAVQEV